MTALYILDETTRRQLSDEPFSVFLILKFHHKEEVYEALLWPTHTQEEHDAILFKYASYNKMPKLPGAMPYYHKLATIENFKKYGYADDITFRDDITNHDEYINALENGLFVMKFRKSYLYNRFIINKVCPETDVSFVRAQLAERASNLGGGGDGITNPRVPV